MKVMNVREHLNCQNYVFPDGRTEECKKVVYEKILERDSMEEGKVYESKIGIVIEGNGKLTAGGTKNINLEQGSIFLLPIGGAYRLAAIDGMKLVMFAVDDKVRFCDRYNLEKLFADTAEQKNKTFAPLKTNERVDSFIRNTFEYINDGFCCGCFMKTKVSELFHIFRVYYSKESLARFFSPLMSNDSEFANFIYENWESAKNLGELAEKSSLSVSGFSKKFKKVFGMPAYQWIMERKSELIFIELSEGDKSLKQLSEELNFYSVHHLGCYCKKKFGLSPGQIRKLHNKELPEEEENMAMAE